MDNMTAMAFDYGLQNIGVAVGQSLTGSGCELPFLKAKDGIPDWQHIQTLLNEWNPVILVVGLPLNMDGTESELSRLARKFGRRLQGRFNKDVVWVDERLSSYEARNEAQQRGHKGNYGKQPIDSIAARFILESWFAQNKGISTIYPSSFNMLTASTYLQSLS